MSGVFDYQRYLDLLVTSEDIRHVFPRDQPKYTWSWNNSGADGWSLLISWETLVVDQVRFDVNRKPNFTGSKVIGYFTGTNLTTSSSTSTVFPANMYTGKILPASEVNIPITTVNLQWSKGTENFQKQLLLIQNWEPGSPIGDPTLDDNFIPIETNDSPLNTGTLVLTGSGPTIYYENFQLTAVTDVPNDLAATASAKFYYRNTGSDAVLIGTAPFVNQVATASIPTYQGSGDPRNLTPGSYTVFAEWPGRRTWRRVLSNTLTQVVYPGIDLSVNLTLTPNPVTNTATTLAIKAVATTATGFTPSGVGINNTVTFTLIGTSTYTAVPTQVISKTAFEGGSISTATASLNIANGFVDTVLNKYATYTVTTSSLTSSTFTVTALITRTYPIEARWDYYRPGLYSGGSTSTTLTVSTSRSFTTQLTPLTVEAIEKFGFPGSGSITAGNPVNQTYNKTPGTSFGIRAYIPYNPDINYTGTPSVTWRAQYTPRFENADIITPANDTTSTVYTLLAVPSTNQFRFSGLPSGTRAGDTFRLANITWTILAVNSASATVSTSPWQGLINPAVYFNTPVTFTLNSVAQNSTQTYVTNYQFLGFNWNEPGSWEAIPNLIPGVSIPPNSDRISDGNYADFNLFHYRFNALPENLKLGDYFKFSSPNIVNPVAHKIFGINRTANTVITWNDNYPDIGGLPTFAVWLDYLNQGLSVVFNSDVAPVTTSGYTTVTLGTSTQALRIYDDGFNFYPYEWRNQLQWVCPATNLNSGTYYISAEIAYDTVGSIIEYGAKASTQTWKLVVNDPVVPIFSSRLDTSLTDNQLTITHYDAVRQSQYGALAYFRELPAVEYYERNRFLTSSTSWIRNVPDDGGQYQQVSLALGTIITATDVTARFPGNVNYPRISASWPKYSTSTFKLFPVYDSNVSIVRDDNYYAWGTNFNSVVSVAGFVNDFNNDPNPSGVVQFFNNSNQLIGTVSGSNGIFNGTLDTRQLITTNPNSWTSSTYTAVYLGSTVRGVSTGTGRALIAPGAVFSMFSNPNVPTYNYSLMNFGSITVNFKKYLEPSGRNYLVRDENYTVSGTIVIGFRPGTIITDLSSANALLYETSGRVPLPQGGDNTNGLFYSTLTKTATRIGSSTIEVDWSYTVQYRRTTDAIFSYPLYVQVNLLKTALNATNNVIYVRSGDTQVVTGTPSYTGKTVYGTMTFNPV
jgi:hypothetical protein